VSSKDETVHELSTLLGVEPHYYDIWGNKHITSLKTKKAILNAMGIQDFQDALRQMKLKPWNRLMEPVMVVSESEQPQEIPLYFPLPDGHEKNVVLRYSIEDESGNIQEHVFESVTPAATRDIEGVRFVMVKLHNETGRPPGYYILRVKCGTPDGEQTGRMKLIVAPEKCHCTSGRTWGISTNLYSLRSKRNWGCGDLSDLKALVKWTGKELGGSFVGINPLHSITNRMPYGISPYSSTSRLFRNFIYLDIERILNGSRKGRKLLKNPEFKIRMDELRNRDLIDYENIALLKLEALKTAFSIFLDTHMKRKTQEAKDFKAYVKSEGKALEDFATFMALEEYLRQENQGLYRWQDWPTHYQNPEDPAVIEFRKDYATYVMLYQFIQWHLEKQLQEVSDLAKDMSVGLYNDLAVGSSGGGSEAWSFKDVFAFGVTAGAPPDAFSMNGQDWGFPPLIPEALKESGYELFIKTIQHNLQHADALRIDHALGLFRLFWIPEGMTPHEGTYVRYPYEDLLGIIALESVRNQCVIIAEDLGTIGEEVRDAISKFGMLSYRLFYFERDWPNRTFLPPGAYPKMALTSVTTHDLPTLNGYWKGRDIAVKTELDLYPDESARLNDIDTRNHDKQLMLDALKDFLPEGISADAGSIPSITPEISLSIHRFLASTSCLIVAVSLDDIMAVNDQQNMPGTIDQHPNWRQRTPFELDELFRNRQALELSRMFNQENRSCPRPEPA
jgi:4-alpha-glucanotransferase